ncbi:pantoate--beta-alanine ligase [soil metagenome]
MLEVLRSEGKSVGFVPTMGALHQGHIELVKKAKSENDIVVVSIFVNPTQFNNQQDLIHYPRTIEKDSDLLLQADCDVLFLPEIEEMYPAGINEVNVKVELDGIDVLMEGAHRPGHFEGVMQIVKKLFDTTGTCKSYFGEKDFQQLAVVKKMVNELKLPVQIIPCPIIREADGLAMSSRNARLTSEERKLAPQIFEALLLAKESWKNSGVMQIKEMVTAVINSEPLFKLEYFEIADTTSLQPVSENQKENVVACIAVQLGAVRLIDNIILG